MASAGGAVTIETCETCHGAIRLHVSSPAASPAPAKAVIVLHGRDRNASQYLQQWRRAIGARPVAVLVPEFDDLRFPGWRFYNLAGMLDEQDEPTAPGTWLFAALEDIRAFTRTRFAGCEEPDLFGHSAGAQLLMRYALFSQGAVDDARFIVANAGWYTVPSPAVAFPYGLLGVAAMPDLHAAFARNLTILVGARDDDRRHHALRRDAGADAQGPTRLHRAQHVAEVARCCADELGASLNWQLKIVDGVAHSNSSMAKEALKLI